MIDLAKYKFTSLRLGGVDGTRRLTATLAVVMAGLALLALPVGAVTAGVSTAQPTDDGIAASGVSDAVTSGVSGAVTSGVSGAVTSGVSGDTAGVSAASVDHQTACEFPVTRTDATGTEVTIEQRPERVTTLAPSAAQTMWEIGGKSQVVGVSQFASYLSDADERANVSAAGRGVSVEKIVATEPDLVLAPGVISPETVESLRDAGLTVFALPQSTSIADVRNKTTLIGRLTGNCAGATATNEWMTANVETAREATADRDRASVLYPVGGGFFAGRNTFINAVIRAAGGANALPQNASFAGYPQVNSETVIASDPDALIVTGFTAGLLGSSPYSELDAVQNDRTVQVNRNWMNQPAPRSVVYAVRNVTRGLHPDAAESAEFPERGEFTTPTPTPSPTPTDTVESVTDNTETTDTATPSAVDDTQPATTDSDGPGFGIAVALVALAAAGLLARRRE